MGMGATNTLDRLAASVGCLDGVAPRFTPSADVPNGGVLLGLPALLAVGLLTHTAERFSLPSGYYSMPSIFLLLAFMALARVKTMEALRYCAPGEWGKLLGLDRVPEVRTLREKVRHLTGSDAPTEWAADLCSEWMAAAPDQAAVFYADGHVRVYHGSEARLPRHYVARQKLCLRATADYWINAIGGQPFFVVHTDIDPGLVHMLQDHLVPQLLKEAPNQPTPGQLQDNPLLHRLTVVFDREGYSPKLLDELKQQRVACLTYHKHPKEDWAAGEFANRRVTLASGLQVEMKIAEREINLQGLCLREIRKLSDTGHQTSVLSTDYVTDAGTLAAAMFARWSQENFFKYMRQEFNLDRIVSYGTEDIPETTRVVNPEYRRLDSEARKLNSQLTRRRAQLAATSIPDDPDAATLARFHHKQGELLELVAELDRQHDEVKRQRREVPKHIRACELPPEHRLDRLKTQSKHFIDTIKMVAYRAESAMAAVLREKMSRPEDTRALLRAIYSNEADIIPDEAAKTLTIRLHHLANRSADEAARHLSAELNSTATVFPGTELRLVYELVSSQNPRDQEV